MGKQPDTESGGNAGRSRWAYAALGSELAGSVLIPVLLGIWLDGEFGWKPWGVVTGAALGMIATGATMARLLIRQNVSKTEKNSKKQ